ncbi:MAG: Mur ligase, partial [Deltaproteobacteria bacterium]|nr:Mur ligase [Deltaproteobacteria bacterium]
GRRQFLWSMYQRGWPILSHLARVYRQTLVRNTRIVTVVGSYGKSTTMRATACALKINAHRLSLRNSKSFVARAVFRIRPYHRHAVIEVGIDGPGQMAHYAHLVRPDLTVVTSIGSEHNRSLHSLESTRAEKSEMIRVLSHTGVAVLNGDDTNVLWMKPHTRAKVVTFGLSEANDIRASDITLDWPKGTRFNLHAYGETRHVTIRLIGPPMVYPILAAIATGLAEGYSLDQILPALAKLSPTPGRLEPVRLPNGAYILRDDQNLLESNGRFIGKSGSGSEEWLLGQFLLLGNFEPMQQVQNRVDFRRLLSSIRREVYLKQWKSFGRISTLKMLS